MSAKASTIAHDVFGALLGESASLGEENDCAVIAAAITTGASYAAAHKVLEGLGRKRGGLSPNYALTKAVMLLGRRFVMHFGWEFGDDGMRSNHISLPPGHALHKAKTMTTAERVLRQCYPGRKFLVRCRGHVSAFDGETLQDWTRGRRHRVTALIEVL
jgi:hypothetical protein